MTSNPLFTDVETALDQLRAGRMIVVVDDEDRENEGDLTMAAEKITPEAINFMAKHGRGLICLAMTPERLDYLRLPPMAAHNTAQFGTAFTHSIDAMGRGVTTGISAYDRAQTILCAIDPATRPCDLARPGHVFPLRARKGGVLVRCGQTEAAVDLTRMAGLTPAGVICEVMNEDGTMSRVPDLARFCGEHGLKMLTVAELIRYRMMHERCVQRVGETTIDTAFGEFRFVAYKSELEGGSHVALVRGDLADGQSPVLVRVQRYCAAGDLCRATGCECAASVESSMRAIQEAGRGTLIYLHQDSAGFTVVNGDRPTVQFPCQAIHPAVEHERRTQHELGIGAQILLDLGLRRVRILTNHPRRFPALEGYGIQVVEQVPIPEAQSLAAHAAASGR